MVVYRFIVTHAQHLLYFAYFLNLLINANLLSLIPVFLILCHAMFERPRPRRVQTQTQFVLCYASVMCSSLSCMRGCV